MSTSTQHFSPILCYTETPNGPTSYRLADYSFVSVTRTDSQRRRRPKGIDLLRQATAAYTTIVLRVDAALNYMSGKNVVHTSVCSVNSNAGYGGETLPDSEDITRNKLLSSARSMSVNLANALGEYKQTAAMFHDGAKAFAGLIGVLHSRNPWVIKRYLFSGSTKGFGKIVSKRILEFQYGVRPLINDINDSILALKKRSESGPICRKVSATTTNTYKRSIGSYDPVPPYSWNPSYVTTTIVDRTIGWGLITLNRDALNRSLGQFGFTNPLAVAYELTAFSFVLDWFFNVGEFLQSLDNCLYFEDGIAQYTRRTYYKRRVMAGGMTALYDSTKISRGPIKQLGSVADIHFKPGFSSTHIVNGLALITQALAKCK